MRLRSIVWLRFALAAAPAILLAGALRAGDWHSGDQLNCSDCHTMHNSSAGQPMRYDLNATPAPHLLRNATSLTLCVYCHDGSNPAAPDVVAPVSYLPDAAGGAFANPGGRDPTGTDHALATPSPVVPPGGTEPMTLTCVSCHEPHGSASYRNLKLSPFGAGTFPVTALQKVSASGGNPEQVYAPTNVVYRSGMSAWCGACHGAFHGRSANEEGTASPWLRHPQDQEISSSAHADYSFWSGTVPNRVPVQSLSGTVPAADNQVFCLSCHKAHGSANKYATLFADGATQKSTCQQCHDE